MGQIPKKVDLPDPSMSENVIRELIEMLTKYSMKLADVINGDMRFEENINSYIATVSDTGSANSEFTVPHTLKRTPNGYFVISNTKNGTVYDGATSWTSTNIYLKCSAAAATVKLLIF